LNRGPVTTGSYDSWGMPSLAPGGSEALASVSCSNAAHGPLPERLSKGSVRVRGGSVVAAGEAFDGGGQVRAAGLDVPPGGLQALVPHQVGDHLDGHPLDGQVVAEGVPQHVRRQLGELGIAVDLVQAELQGPGLQRPPLADEGRVVVVLAGGEVLPQGVADPQPQREGALLAALAPADPQRAGPIAVLEVLAPDGDGLVEQDAGVHQGEDEGGVAEAAVAADGAG